MGLVTAGIFSAFCGLSQIIHPIPYFSTGGVGRFAGIKVMSVFSGNDARFTGGLILFLGCFLLTAAYKIKKPHVRKRKNDGRPESADNPLPDTTGTPWEHDQDHTTRS